MVIDVEVVGVLEDAFAMGVTILIIVIKVRLLEIMAFLFTKDEGWDYSSILVVMRVVVDGLRMN